MDTSRVNKTRYNIYQNRHLAYRYGGNPGGDNGTGANQTTTEPPHGTGGLTTPNYNLTTLEGTTSGGDNGDKGHPNDVWPKSNIFRSVKPATCLICVNICPNCPICPSCKAFS